MLWYNNNHNVKKNLCIEEIYHYHFKLNNLKLGYCEVIQYTFNHICSKFCGHNKENMIIK